MFVDTDDIISGGTFHDAPVALAADLLAAALRAARALERAREGGAIALLCGCEAIDLLAPLITSAPLARALVRSRAPTLDDDCPPAPDIVAIAELIATSELGNACGGVVK